MGLALRETDLAVDLRHYIVAGWPVRSLRGLPSVPTSAVRARSHDFRYSESMAMLRGVDATQDKLLAEAISSRHPAATSQYIGYFDYSTKRSGQNHKVINFGRTASCKPQQAAQ